MTSAVAAGKVGTDRYDKGWEGMSARGRDRRGWFRDGLSGRTELNSGRSGTGSREGRGRQGQSYDQACRGRAVSRTQTVALRRALCLLRLWKTPPRRSRKDLVRSCPAWGDHHAWCPHAHDSRCRLGWRGDEHRLRNACRRIPGWTYRAVLSLSWFPVYLFFTLWQLSRFRTGGRSWRPATRCLCPRNDRSFAPQRMVEVREIRGR